MKRSLVFLAVVVFAVYVPSAFSMTITPFDSASNLAQSLVGPGVVISNITYTGATAASGYFSGGTAAGIGIPSGIVLTSGFASNLNGTSNTSGGITGNNGLPGNATLTALIPGYNTLDATILEFDYVATGDTVFFQYVFGSDEYNEWVGSSFNDVFGFFANGTNVALIPGTTTPVSINNVNLGANAGFYNNNAGGAFPFEYDGFTTPLTATISGLTPGTTYHLMLGIADAGDRILDSGVFLTGGSFSTEPPNGDGKVPEPASLILLGSGLIGLAAMRRRTPRS